MTEFVASKKITNVCTERPININPNWTVLTCSVMKTKTNISNHLFPKQNENSII